MTDLALSCDCGAVTGVAHVADPRHVNRVVCYCKDCQRFPSELSHAATLDAYGGSDLFQMAPYDMSITKGSEHIRAIRFSEKGLYRWYAGCCKTPMGNMVGPDFPFIGIVHSFVAARGKNTAMDHILGPVAGHVHIKSAIGDLPEERRKMGFPIRVMARTLKNMVKWRFRGRDKPTPFFQKDGTPIAVPVIVLKS